MTTEVRTYQVTIPAGTLQASPVTISLPMPARIVTGLRWRVPPGPRGLVGWALSVAGSHVFPWGDTSWIVADDETDDIALTNVPSTGKWSLVGYNTGLLDHTVYLTFRLEPLTAPIVIAASGPLELSA